MPPHARDAGPAVPPWPVVQLTLDAAGRAAVDGRPIVVPEGTDPQPRLLAEATRRAADLGRPLRVRATDPVGTWHLVAYPEGDVVEVSDPAGTDPDEGGFLLGPDDTGDPDDLDDPPEGPWHLRVHPNGVITPVNELPVPDEEAYVPRPEPGWVPEPEPDPATPEAPGVAESDPATPEAAAQPDPGPADNAWHELPEPPPPLLAPDPVDLVRDLRSTADVPAPVRHRRWIPVAVASTLGALAVGGIAVVVRSPDTPSTSPPVSASSPQGIPAGVASSSVAAAPAPALAAPPASLDIGPPPGFSTKPVWALAVPGTGATTVSADGLVVSLTADRQVVLLDPASGAARWQTAAPARSAGPFLSRVEGTRVIAMLTATHLLYWPLSDQAVPQRGSGPTEVPLPPASAVTWAGPSPLVVLGDGTAAVVRGSRLEPVSLPTGARPLAADGTDVLAVTGRNWIRQAAGKAPGTPRQLAMPEGANGRAPIRVENVGGSFLGAMWPGPDGPIVAVYDARTGSKLVQAAFPKDVDFATAPTVREPGSDRTAVGSALFEPAQRNLSILGSSYSPVALTPGHVFANDDDTGRVTDLQIKGKDLTAVRFPARNPTVPVGITTVGSRSLALVVVRQGSGWLLCALPSR